MNEQQRASNRIAQAKFRRTDHGRAYLNGQQKIYQKTKKGKIVQQRWQQKIRLICLRYYSQSDYPFCACCGEPALIFLCIDHIAGGGNKHRKELRKNFFSWIIQNEFPPGFQVLCYNCNNAKRILGRCPHQVKRSDE